MFAAIVTCVLLVWFIPSQWTSFCGYSSSNRRLLTERSLYGFMASSGYIEILRSFTLCSYDRIRLVTYLRETQLSLTPFGQLSVRNTLHRGRFSYFVGVSFHGWSCIYVSLLFCVLPSSITVPVAVFCLLMISEVTGI